MPDQMPDPKEASEIAKVVMDEIAAEHARERDRAEVFKRKPALPLQLIAGILVMLSVLMTLLNVTGRMPFTGVEPRSEAERRLEMRRALNFGVRTIDAYRRRYGRLPGTLAELGGPTDPSWQFQVLEADTYSLQLTRDGQTVTYISTEDADAFFSDLRRR